MGHTHHSRQEEGQNNVCVDYRKLNDVTINDFYACFEVLAGSVNSVVDIGKWRWRTLKMAITMASDRLFHFIVMPFGLFNTPATYGEGSVRITLECLPCLHVHVPG